MRTADFDYELPPELIASQPPKQREDSRMMVVDRESGSIEHRPFREFPNFLQPNDLAVLNDTRVVPARFFSNDGRIELLQIAKESDTRWECMVKPGKRMRLGRTVEIGEATGTVDQILENGHRVITFDQVPDTETYGHLALPPYMNREDGAEDRERYQTVYAKREGAIAAPTAGLHFSPEMVNQLNHTFVTLHVGAGTFLPVKAEDLTNHEMHSEWFELSDEAATQIEAAARVIAIGTTVVRVLEHCAQAGLPLQSQTGDTQIFIHPPYEFQVIDALLTNFHLPKSTLLMLIRAFAGRELVLEAYAKAVEERYRFY
ncbi:MAG: tRNA preQ1(34) S-adenosylmethionine ribosyltransferase-isomerase QueA, partial [Verrucomicrobiota bacterium]